MSTQDRRRFLKAFVGGILGTTSTVVLARTTLQAESAENTATDETGAPQPDAKERADELSSAIDSDNDCAAVALGFRRGAFRNGGGFRNGGFRNSAFRNGAGFRNSGFRNSGFRNGGFRRGGFRRF